MESIQTAILREAKEEDFSFFFGLYMHPEINPFLLYELMDEKEFFPIWKELLEKGVLYVMEENGRPIGMCKLIPQYFRNAHVVYLGGVAIHPENRGLGYGKKLIELIIKRLDRFPIKRIELTTATFNARAIKLYEKMGFKVEGVLKNYTWLKSENRFIDEVMMSYLF